VIPINYDNNLYDILLEAMRTFFLFYYDYIEDIPIFEEIMAYLQ
jgi:hypothetical protein